MRKHDWNILDENEQPLDHLVENGGMCAIFRLIGCIGDSLSSGEFESSVGFHDMFEYSWGQFMARNGGYKVLNFSRGGMTAKEYRESFAEANDFWNPDKLCQAYVIALGVNDLLNFGHPLGTIDDIREDYRDNPDTFIGNYTAIIGRLRSMRPDAYFFLMTMPNEPDLEPQRIERKMEHRQAIFEIAKQFPRTYVLDLYAYAPLYDAEFRRRYCMGFHMNPMGYAITARMVESYIDYLIRHNPEDFYQVPYIGTTLRNETVKY